MNEMVLIESTRLKDLIGDVITEKLNLQKSVVYPEVPGKLISEKELCAFLNIGPATLYRWRQKRKIPFVQVGLTIRYNQKDVLEALTVKKVS